MEQKEELEMNNENEAINENNQSEVINNSTVETISKIQFCNSDDYKKADPERESSPQERFDSQYITGKEIAERLNVTRMTVLNAKKRNILPDAIKISPNALIYIWERKALEPYLKAWETILNQTRVDR